MNRVNAVWNHGLYKKAYQKIQELEHGRRFCGHSVEHFLAVARLAWIYSLEDQARLNREIVYATALLHDIGRHRQYLDGTPHHEASAELAARILPECGFLKEETEEILRAILGHRSPELRQEKSLRGYLYRADKQSRNCLACDALEECDWPPEKKNLTIDY